MAIAADEELVTVSALEFRIWTLKAVGAVERAKALEQKLQAMLTAQN